MCLPPKWWIFVSSCSLIVLLGEDVLKAHLRAGSPVEMEMKIPASMSSSVLHVS